MKFKLRRRAGCLFANVSVGLHGWFAPVAVSLLTRSEEKRRDRVGGAACVNSTRATLGRELEGALHHGAELEAQLSQSQQSLKVTNHHAYAGIPPPPLPAFGEECWLYLIVRHAP